MVVPRASSSSNLILVPGDYNSIQAAIANAGEGSKILVSPGEYVEHLTIDKPLALIGSGNSTVIQNDGTWPMTIDVERGVDGVTLADFSVNCSVGSSTTGLYIAGEDCNVQNITVANHDTGIFIWDSSGDVLRNNRMVNNKHNLEVWGLTLSQFLHDIDDSNLVDGRKVYYWVNESDKIVPTDAGYVAIINSMNITIKDVNLMHNYSGILLSHSSNCLVLNTTCSSNSEGILVVLSNYNTIVNNTFDSNDWTGISLCSSSDNYIAGNTVNAMGLPNLPRGIYLYYSNLVSDRSDNNTICGNFLTRNYYGMYLDTSSENQVCNNEITDNTVGARLDTASQNLFVGNSFSQNRECGVKIDASGNNSLYHNSFLNNTAQVSYVEEQILPPPVNEWDDGYPTGGNYWSDYSGHDIFSGPYQNETGSDGIGDLPYSVDRVESDRYPLYVVPEENTLLKADFSYSPSEPRLYDLVNFVDETKSSSNISLRFWVFSDDQIFLSQNVSRQFVQSQNYTAVLYVIDVEGTTSFAEMTFHVRKINSTLTLTAQNESILSTKVPIKAELRDEQSTGLPNATIYFYAERGTSQEWIGSSTTNFAGDATISQSFNETGLLTIYAEYVGDQSYVSSSSELSLRIVNANNLSPVFIVAASSSLVVAALLLLAYGWIRRKKSRSAINKEKVTSV
jgi:parallel beta-helix repeat protein